MKTVLLVLLSGWIALTAAEKPKDYREVETRYGFKVVRRNPLTGTVFVNYTKGDWQPQIYLAIAVQNDYLQFEKKDSLYFANYEINAVLSEGEKTLFTESWLKQVTLDNFEATNSRSQFQYHIFLLRNIFPDETLSGFRCKVEFRDRISHQSALMKRTLSLSPRHTKIAFLTAAPQKNKKLPLVPTISTLNFPNAYWSFARFNAGAARDLRAQIRLYREQGEQQVLMRQGFVDLQPDSNAVDLLYKLPTDSMPEGRYLLRFQVDTMMVEKSFDYLWFEKPTYLYKYDLAVRPMRYILSEEEWKNVKSMGLERLTQWFKQYWKQRDPTPATEYNELLNEFYQRVSEANRKFSSRHKEGWETDRGKILILYGPPKKIKNRAFATDTAPHVIWIYDEGLRFLFVDTKRNGDFKLIENVTEQ